MVWYFCKFSKYTHIHEFLHLSWLLESVVASIQCFQFGSGLVFMYVYHSWDNLAFFSLSLYLYPHCRHGPEFHVETDCPISRVSSFGMALAVFALPSHPSPSTASQPPPTTAPAPKTARSIKPQTTARYAGQMLQLRIRQCVDDAKSPWNFRCRCNSCWFRFSTLDHF